MQVSRMVGHDVDVASTRAPVTEGALLLDKGFHSRALIGCQDLRDLLDGNLQHDCTDRFFL